jgi:hypothetical protein
MTEVSRPLWIIDGDPTLPAAQLADHVDCATIEAATVEGREVVIWATTPVRRATLAAKLLNNGHAPASVVVVATPDGWDIAEMISRDPVAWDYQTLDGLAYAKGRAVVRDPEPEPKPTPKPRAVVALSDAQQSAALLWEQYRLERPGNGPPYANADNVMRVLENIPQFSNGGLWWDTFRNRPMTDWKCEPGVWREWNDEDDTVLMIYLERTLAWGKLGITAVSHGITGYLAGHKRNPLTDYLDGLKHDGTPRLASFMDDVYGTGRSPYLDNAGRCFLVGLIARAYEPGCQLDTMIVLEGSQGLKKSSSLAILGGDFYAALPRDFGGIEFLHDMDGAWLAEIPDMSGFRGRDMEHVKAFITIRSDRFRAKYGRRSQTHPRHCVFAGTSNSSDWLDDATGGRRFIPIACRDINLDYLRDHRDQLFAEARDLYKLCPPASYAFQRIEAGADWWNMPHEDTKMEQEARQQEDPWTGTIRYWLKGRKTVEIADIMEHCLEVPKERQDLRISRRIASILKRSDYENKSVREGKTIVKRWILTTDSAVTGTKSEF